MSVKAAFAVACLSLVLSSGIASADPPADTNVADVPVITTPPLLRRPNADYLAQYYPPTGQQRGHSGSATMRCRATARGTLRDCKVLSEQPALEGFGTATVRIAPLFKMKSAAEGGPVEGAVIIVTLDWRLPLR